MTVPHRPGAPRSLGTSRLLTALCGLFVSAWGCSERAVTAPPPPPPAHVDVQADESELNRITLTPAAVERLGIETARIERRPIGSIRWIGGEVILPSDAVRVLTAPVAATVGVDSAPPAHGAAVEAGQLLVVLSPVVPPDALANLRAATATAAGEVERARVRLEIATTQRDRTQKLLDQGATSTRLRDEAVAEFDSARAALAAAKSAHEVLLSALPSTPGGTAEIEIRAPFAGVVRRVDITPGQELAAGAMLAEIVAPDRVQVRVSVHVGEAPSVDPRSPVLLRTASEVLTLQPALAPPSADPLAAAVHLFYDPGDAAASLRPGQRVEVGVRSTDATPREIAPFSAVVFDAYGGAWVYERTAPTEFVRRRVDVREVQATRADGRMAVFAHGPAAGTEVVTAGATELFGTEFGGSE